MSSGDDTSTLWLPNSVMRERAKVGSVTVEGLAAVRGYMKPQYVDELPDGRRVARLWQRDYDRVIDGYGCGECLAFFDERFQTCPGCGHEMDANADVVEWNPGYWRDGPSRTSAEILRDF